MNKKPFQLLRKGFFIDQTLILYLINQFLASDISLHIFFLNS